MSHFEVLVRRLVSSMCVISLCCGASSLALAQTSSAGLALSVSDTSGAVIQGATVSLRNSDTDQQQTSVSNKSGSASFPFLKPGHYVLTVSKDGFSDVTIGAILLNVGDEKQLQLVLKVGAESQNITVDGSGVTLNTTDGSVSTVVDRRFVANIPLNGRSFQDLISMTPGVVTQSPQTANQAVGAYGDFSVNGQRTQSNYYIVDGVAANIGAGNGGGVAEAASGGMVPGATALGTTQSLIPVDALQEFRVLSSTYSAEYGRSPGGQFSLVSRSGSNQIHGSIYDYLRNEFFDANDWFNDYYGKPSPSLRQNDFGGTFGSPISIPKLYSGKDHTFIFAAYEGLRLTLPTAATPQYVPDLFMRQQAVPTMQAILNAFPIPNGIDYGTSANPNLAQFISTYSLPSTIDSTSIRVDQSVGSKWSLFFRSGYTPSSTGIRQYNARDTTRLDDRTYTLGATVQLSPRITDDFRLGYAHSNSSDIGVLDSFGGATPINLASTLGAATSSPVQPFIVMILPGAGGPAYLEPYYGQNLGRQWNVVDTINLSSDKHHNIKIGVDYRHVKSPIRPVGLEVISEFINTNSVLNGAPLITQPVNYRPETTPVFDETALFAQDEWRAHPRFHLSWGIRWEVDPPPTEEQGYDAYTLIGNIKDPASLMLAPQGTPLWKTTWFNFAPRLGMAWIAHNQQGRETVIRAGGGVFFDSANEDAMLGFSGLGFRAYKLEYGLVIPYTLSELTVPVAVTSPPYTTTYVVAFPTHLQLPYALEWNASVEQAIGAGQSLTVSYVASNGRRLLGQQELSPSTLNPNFGTIDYYDTNLTSSYNALQVQFHRSVAQGIQTLVSYTWSHSLDFGSNATALPYQRGNSDFDVRNNLQGGITWDLPSLQRARLLAPLLSGWGVDARVNARSAFPVTLAGNTVLDATTGSYYYSGLSLVPNQPIYIYGSQYPGRKAINKAAFVLPSGSSIGDAPRNFVRGFGAAQVNFAVRRYFRLHDSIGLQFRAESFNTFNHPNFGYVDPVYTDATFGQSTKMLGASLGTMASQYQQGGPRSMQFALRLQF